MNLSVLENQNTGSYDKNLEDSLRRGYKEMSPINQSLAEEAVQSDNEALALSEQNVRSVKLSDS